jgi:hypothetical protein
MVDFHTLRKRRQALEQMDPRLWTNRVYHEGIRNASMEILPIAGSPFAHLSVQNGHEYEVVVWNAQEKWEWDLVGQLRLASGFQGTQDLLIHDPLVLWRDTDPRRVNLRVI